MKFKERPKGPTNFLAIKSGESVKGVLRGELFDFNQHWVNNKSILCSGDPGCVPCSQGSKKSFRFRANIMIPTEPMGYVCKILEQGGRVYDELKTLAEDYDLEKTVIKISRTGEKMQTKYSVVPLPGSVDPQRFEGIPTNDLTKFEEPDLESPDDQIPF